MIHRDDDKNIDLDKRIGFFDVDSRELSKDGGGLAYRERVLPWADKLDRIYDFIYSHKLKLVFSTCCSGRFLEKDSLEYVLYIPEEKADSSWRKKIGQLRYFYLAKHSFHNPRQNFEQCTYDIFKYNENAGDLFQSLGLDHWVIFGNGFDLCVHHAAKALLKMGKKITILEDALISSACVYGDLGTEAGKKRLLGELERSGARLMATGKFFEQYD